MDDNLEKAANEAEKNLNDAAENAWKPVEEAAEQAQSHVDDVTEASETVQGEWSEVKDDFQKASAETWSAPEAPNPLFPLNLMPTVGALLRSVLPMIPAAGTAISTPPAKTIRKPPKPPKWWIMLPPLLLPRNPVKRKNSRSGQ